MNGARVFGSPSQLAWHWGRSHAFSKRHHEGTDHEALTGFVIHGGTAQLIGPSRLPLRAPFGRP
jgi:hypothetical protein